MLQLSTHSMPSAVVIEIRTLPFTISRIFISKYSLSWLITSCIYFTVHCYLDTAESFIKFCLVLKKREVNGCGVWCLITFVSHCKSIPSLLLYSLTSFAGHTHLGHYTTSICSGLHEAGPLQHCRSLQRRSSELYKSHWLSCSRLGNLHNWRVHGGILSCEAEHQQNDQGQNIGPFSWMLSWALPSSELPSHLQSHFLRHI